MRIIFLDIDGVLNSMPYLLSVDAIRNDANNPEGAIDARHVAILNEIIRLSGAEVIISSSWRSAYSPDEIQKILELRGFIGQVIGATPLLHNHYSEDGELLYRGNEIQQWLDKTDQNIESFIIIDDDSDMEHLTHRLINTDLDSGLTAEHIPLALSLFDIKL